MRIKLINNAEWLVIEKGVCHELMVEGFDRHLAAIDLSFGCWWLYPDPESFVPVAEGECETLKNGKRQVKEALIELGML